MSSFAQAATPTCRAAIEAARQILKKRCGASSASDAPRKSSPCWRDTPELYRRMIAHVAGLNKEVITKPDKELSETEKVMLRSAVTDMRDYMNALVNL